MEYISQNSRIKGIGGEDGWRQSIICHLQFHIGPKQWVVDLLVHEYNIEKKSMKYTRPTHLINMTTTETSS